MVTKRTEQTEVADCPDCGVKVTLQAPVWIGQRVTCSDCGADLEVIATAPVELDWYYEDEPEEDDEDEEW